MSEPRYLPLVDTHAHVNLDDFAPDLPDLLNRSREGRFPPIKGRQIDDPILRPFVAGIVCPAVDLESSLRGIELAKEYDFIFAAVGFHPNHTALMQPEDWDACERLVLERDAAANNIVALGETGLDRYWDDAPFDLQRKYFLQTLELGLRAELPVIVHSRDANDDLMAALREFCADARPNSARGVIHSFSGTLDQAEELVEMGFYLGFGGFVTYTSKKFAELWDVARRVRADRILLETDSPFLTPHPLRGKLERNEPLASAFAAQRLAELRGEPVDVIVRAASENAIRLFNLPNLLAAPESAKASQTPNE